MGILRHGKIVIKHKAIFSLVFLLWPVLNIYGFASEAIGLGDIILLIATIIVFLKRRLWKSRLIQESVYFKFYAFTLFFSFGAYLFTVTGNTYGIALSLIKTTIYVFIFSVLAPKIIDFDIFVKQYRTICMVLSIAVFIQAVLHYTSGFSDPFIVNSSLFPVRDVNGYESYISSWRYHLTYEAYKPPSLFSEASKYAQYVVPCLFLSLQRNRRNNFWFEILISIALALSMSTNAVVFMAVSWCSWILFTRENKKTILKIIVAIVGVAAIVFMLFGETWFSSRMKEIGGGATSGGMRVLRGWIVYGFLPPLNKLIGVGISNVASYIDATGIKTGLDAGYSGYMSGLSEVAVASGAISLVLFIIVFIRYFKRGGELGKGIALLLIVMLVSSAILNNPTFGVSIMILEVAIRNSKKERREAMTDENVYNNSTVYR